MAQFNYQAAIKAGYTPDQINSYLNSPQANQDVNNFGRAASIPSAPAAPAQQPTDFYSQLGQGAANIVGNITKPFVETGKNILTALASPLAIGANTNAQVAANQNVPSFIRTIAGLSLIHI